MGHRARRTHSGVNFLHRAMGTLMLTLCLSVAAQTEAPAAAAWTVMIFMDGDNDLDRYALDDFEEMARVGSDQRVNILVQLDRAANETSTPNAHWTQTVRFRVKQGMVAQPNAGLDLGEVDMGSPAALSEFIAWGTRGYPADHYALVIWDHGQGWRLTQPLTVKPSDDNATDCDRSGTSSHANASRSSSQGAFKSCSFDATDNDELYNSEIRSASEGAGSKLDVLGFDACLMGMIEPSYEFRKLSHYLVASEDLVPGTGWYYDDWLRSLKKTPGMSPAMLARTMVSSYGSPYATLGQALTDPYATLSAIDLTKIEGVTTAISTFSESCLKDIQTLRPSLLDARRGCLEYAPNHKGDGQNYFFHIDLIRWLELVADKTPSPEIARLARGLIARLHSAIAASIAGECRRKEYGSHGVAIYFPPTIEAFDSDAMAGDGYRKTNDSYPVAFVRESSWPDLLIAMISNQE